MIFPNLMAITDNFLNVRQDSLVFSFKVDTEHDELRFNYQKPTGAIGEAGRSLLHHQNRLLYFSREF